MAITINTNNTATIASINLNRSNGMLRNSLNRLSSGKSIVNASDDAGGLAVSMKLTAALHRSAAVDKNISNAISLLQTQDGALSSVGNILDRMSELRTLADDVTKNTSDKANYNTEFVQLKSQLANIALEKFNGISLFATGSTATTMSVFTTEQGNTAPTVVVSVSKSLLIKNLSIGSKGLTDVTTTNAATTSLQAFTVDNLRSAIENVATLRAQNGGQTSRLQFAQQQLQTNMANLEQANSRIIDVDVASESTKFARYNILVQSGASMLSQANGLSAIALQLLQ
jgi:flagellin